MNGRKALEEVISKTAISFFILHPSAFILAGALYLPCPPFPPADRCKGDGDDGIQDKTGDDEKNPEGVFDEPAVKIGIQDIDQPLHRLPRSRWLQQNMLVGRENRLGSIPDGQTGRQTQPKR